MCLPNEAIDFSQYMSGKLPHCVLSALFHGSIVNLSQPKRHGVTRFVHPSILI